MLTRFRIALILLTTFVFIAIFWKLRPHKADSFSVLNEIPLQRIAIWTEPAACFHCHEKQFQSWSGSNHHKAMQIANEQTVLGDFSDFVFSDGKTRFYRRDGRYWVNTEGPNGKWSDFEIKYTFGIDPLQQYLVEFPNGRIQCLPIAWDVKKQKWYSLNSEFVTHTSPLHFSQIDQNWNYMCAECHTTGFEKNYNTETNGYASQWLELGVGCQACHGPGSVHVEAAERKDLSQSVLYEANQIETCAPCHSHRRTISTSRDAPRSFWDRYQPSLLVEPLYFADGQIQGEVFEYGSFLQAKKYQRGVTCLNCHDPHSGKLLRPGNSLCTECHQSNPPSRFTGLKAKNYDSSEHHHHLPNQAGCVDCHMPTRTYMGIDVRHDHSFRIPRPGLSETLNTPNTCNQCHNRENSKWAYDQLVKWNSQSIRLMHPFAQAFSAAQRNNGLIAPDLEQIALNETVPGIVRATALHLWASVQEPTQVSAASFRAIAQLSSAENSMLRIETVGTLPLFGSKITSAEINPILQHLLHDTRFSVRAEAAYAASRFSELDIADRNILNQSSNDFLLREQTNLDRPESLFQMGMYYENISKLSQAEAAYQKALHLLYSFNPARIRLAALKSKESDIAMKYLQEAVEVDPEDGASCFALGLFLAEQKQLEKAITVLEKASVLLPNDHRIVYNLGLLFHQIKQFKKAEITLLRANGMAPHVATIVYAIAVLYIGQNQPDKALQWVDRFVSMSPKSTEGKALRLQLKKIQKTK